MKNSGKTDIAFRLLNKKRVEFITTNGCRTFTTKIDKRIVKFTELGGEEFFDIWKYYFLDVSYYTKKKSKFLVIKNIFKKFICPRFLESST
jgi:hypothetical protein